MDRKGWLLFLLCVNLVGFLFGIYYYWNQLMRTSPLLWVFVIDCPLFVLLFAYICWQNMQEREVPDMFKFLTSVGLIKYGLWTVFVVWYFGSVFFSLSPTLYSILFPLHIGMMAEGFVLLPRFKAEKRHALPVLIWFLLCDVLDYSIGTHPWVPSGKMDLLYGESVLSSIIIVLNILWISPLVSSRREECQQAQTG